MNACVVVTGESKRITVSPGGRSGIAIRVEGVDPEVDMYLDLDAGLAREIANTLSVLADELEGEE